MRGHVVANTLNKYKIINKNDFYSRCNLKEKGSNIILNYENNCDINVLLNKLYKNSVELIFEKKGNNIFIKFMKVALSKVYDDNQNNILDDDISLIINLLKISNDLTIIVSSDKMRLYTTNYLNIINNLLIYENNYYILNREKLNRLYQEIKKYNKLTSITNCKIDKNFTNFTITEVNKYLTNTSTLIIFKDGYQNKLIIKDEKNISFTSSNSTTFINIFLPEILKKYSHNFNEIDKEELIEQYNRFFYRINDNLYILNYEEEIIKSNINFLHELYKKNKYKLDISTNYYLTEELEDSISSNSNEYKPSYSYGYINILLISFIISILTIIICFTR